MNERVAPLVAAFERIAATRMAGLPFLNAKLRVEAVGFRRWQGQWIGALVTPWSINLVLLPGEGEWPRLRAGEERFLDLPAGRFRFIGASDDTAGEYHACSLFSPALEFADHATARATAAAAVEALFDCATALAGTPRGRGISRRAFLGAGRGANDGDRG